MGTEHAQVTVTPSNYPLTVILEVRPVSGDGVDGLTVGRTTRVYRGNPWKHVKSWIAAEPETFFAAENALLRGTAVPFGDVDITIPDDVQPNEHIAHG